MARVAQAIAFHSFAQSHEPLPEFQALALAPAPLAIASDILMLTLCPAIALHQLSEG
jgi:hypothetical protein